MVVLVLIAVFVSNPDWLGALRGLLPVIPDYAPFVNGTYAESASK